MTREVNKCAHRFTLSGTCRRCGLYQYRSEALKTTTYSAPFHFNLEHYYRTLKQTSAKVVEGSEISEETFSLLISICDKFTFTPETLALGLHIFQCVRELNPNERFWSATALVVAGKAVELDKNVPYLNRYQRYADKSFTQDDYEQGERVIFNSLDHNVHFSTFVTFLDFFLTCGVLFKEDGLSEPLVEFFEDDIKSRAREMLKKGNFSRF